MRGGGEVVMDIVTAVGDPGEHVDTVSKDEANTAEETSEEERGGEKDKGKDQHGPVVPVAEGINSLNNMFGSVNYLPHFQSKL